MFYILSFALFNLCLSLIPNNLRRPVGSQGYGVREHQVMFVAKEIGNQENHIIDIKKHINCTFETLFCYW